MRQIHYILCVIPCLLSIVGCITTTPYPNDWSQRATNTTVLCPDLTGSYENSGLRAEGSADKDVAMLTTILFPDPEQGLGWQLLNSAEELAISHVTIEDRGDNGLLVKAWVGDELFMESLLTAQQLSCVEGRRIYHDTYWGLDGLWPGLPLVTRNSADSTISLAVNGSLVIQKQVSGAGVFIVIPIAGKSQNWYRFNQTSPGATGLHNDSKSPKGVRSGTAPAYRLLLPEGKPKSRGYSDETKCLNLERGKDVTPDPQALAMLGGRSTQTFIIQYGRDGPLYPEGTYDGEKWIPATHGLRIEKLHWQPPSVADRYVICLLRKGYRWEDLGECTVDDHGRICGSYVYPKKE
jgi:hypothetical protein